VTIASLRFPSIFVHFMVLLLHCMVPLHRYHLRSADPVLARAFLPPPRPSAARFPQTQVRCGSRLTQIRPVVFTINIAPLALIRVNSTTALLAFNKAKQTAMPCYCLRRRPTISSSLSDQSSPGHFPARPGLYPAFYVTQTLWLFLLA